MRYGIIAAAVAGLLLGAAAPAPGTDTGQVILDNNASIDGDLYVDETYVCHAPSHGECFGDVPAGIHVATIRFSDGDYLVSDPFEVPAGMSITLPIRDLTT